MKKHILFFLFACSVALLAQAQSVTGGFQYQAVARDAAGKPLINVPVSLKVSLGSVVGESETFYTEVQDVMTDAQGLFTVIIGEGTPLKGALAEVPWADKQIWLNVAAQNQNDPRFRVISNSRVLAVPYALHASTTSELVNLDDPAEKNQSIYWTTGGNSLTVPPTHFLGTRDNQNLVFKTNNIPRMVLTKEGQMQVTSGVGLGIANAGDDEILANYPMTIEGSQQGIYIKVNGSRTGANNFVTFGDDVKFRWGTVEGQTFPELEAYWAYQLQVALYTLTGVGIAAGIVTQTASAVAAFASVCGAGIGVGEVLDAAALVIDLANLLNQSITWGTKIRQDIGVSYSTGAGDYAEWLERLPEERDFYPGEIVGVRGGKITLNTTVVDHYMVVSTIPAVLGNLPPTEEDEARFEKVAFMGQVPVRVIGKVAVGDYILPSGNNDGFAIAVNPNEMKIGDYTRIVGVAWEANKTELPYNLINVAVGINTNDLSREVVQLEEKVAGIMAYLKGESTSVIAEQGATANYFTTAAPVTGGKAFSDEEFDQILDNNSAMVNQIFTLAKNQLTKMGRNLEENPHLLAFLDNPIPVLKQIRRDPAFFAQWVQFDQTVNRKGTNN